MSSQGVTDCIAKVGILEGQTEDALIDIAAETDVGSAKLLTTSVNLQKNMTGVGAMSNNVKKPSELLQIVLQASK